MERRERRRWPIIFSEDSTFLFEDHLVVETTCRNQKKTTDTSDSELSKVLNFQSSEPTLGVSFCESLVPKRIGPTLKFATEPRPVLFSIELTENSKRPET